MYPQTMICYTWAAFCKSQNSGHIHNLVEGQNQMIAKNPQLFLLEIGVKQCRNNFVFRQKPFGTHRSKPI